MLCAGGMIWLPPFLHFCFLFLSCLIAVLKPEVLSWNKYGNQYLVSFQIVLEPTSLSPFWYSAGCGFAMHSLMLRYDPSAPGLSMFYFERTFDFITYFFCIDWEMIMRFFGPSSCWWTISHLSICIDWAVLASWDDSAWSCPSRGCAGQ